MEEVRKHEAQLETWPREPSGSRGCGGALEAVEKSSEYWVSYCEPQKGLSLASPLPGGRLQRSHCSRWAREWFLKMHIVLTDRLSHTITLGDLLT